ncbi:MAG: phosphoglycerate dehydrogenase [Lachnospiraceae bacterium]|nr:phosphoglycerate dehydrogenase [Lachnospiraceae bacterium]
MFKYHCLNPIAKVGLERLGSDYQETENLAEADAILVRSASVHELELGENLKAIARAGAGVNNIPLDKCAEDGIVVFNTPGANANGVKELVLAGMLLAARDIIGGINWVQEYEEDGDIAKVTEKKKSSFAGTELMGKKLGVIGLGAIGVMVANAATHLGMDVYGFDPYMSVESAWQLSRSIHHAKTMDEIFKDCDYISLNVPAVADTKNMICKNSLSLMKDGVVILNFARDILVNSEDMVDALLTGKVKRYVTDFPTKEMTGVKGAIVIPHLGASTEESEDNCAVMVCKEVVNFLEHGNIVNSVNFPDCVMGKKGERTRITILHRNIPTMLSQFTDFFASQNINIHTILNKSKEKYAYTMMEVDADVEQCVEKALSAIKGVLRVRKV